MPAVCFLFSIFMWFLATGGGGLFDGDEGDDADRLRKACVATLCELGK